MQPGQTWERFCRLLYTDPATGLSLDISRMMFEDGFFEQMQDRISIACEKMDALEKGVVANPDENRMVGHYWLRDPQRAPSPAITGEIEFTIRAVTEFTGDVHSGAIRPADGRKFSCFLLVGIGGSALGPQLLADSLAAPNPPMRPFFFDNTDPEGFDRTLATLGERLSETLCIIISKSGGTKETRNGMLEAEAAFRCAGLDFRRHAVAVTGAGSELDRLASAQGWLARFPMWDWVGGRTSITSAVGLLPAALLGIDIQAFLEGARFCDRLTREKSVGNNPAALLALMWFHATGGKGAKDMVVLPYKDRLILFSRYLQQLVMESLGKELNLAGERVEQGLSVYGNKGSTDQHAYVQQLREGVHNFFVTFIEVLTDRNGDGIEVEEGITSGDYLEGFYLGTREALSEKSRESLTISIPKVDPFYLGMLISLYERAVGLYAFLIDINAYHQPGVEAGKKAAGRILELQGKVIEHLRSEQRWLLVDEIAIATGGDPETIYLILRHIAANSQQIEAEGTRAPNAIRYRYIAA